MCWLPLEGWQIPVNEKINYQRHTNINNGVREGVGHSAHFTPAKETVTRQPYGAKNVDLSHWIFLDGEKTWKYNLICFATHTACQQLFSRVPRDVSKVLYKITGCLKHSQDLLISPRHEVKPSNHCQTLHVVSMDLWPGDFMPCFLLGDKVTSYAAVICKWWSQQAACGCYRKKSGLECVRTELTDESLYLSKYVGILWHFTATVCSNSISDRAKTHMKSTARMFNSLKKQESLKPNVNTCDI